MNEIHIKGKIGKTSNADRKERKRLKTRRSGRV
jgi:hypothetical protein